MTDNAAPGSAATAPPEDSGQQGQLGPRQGAHGRPRPYVRCRGGLQDPRGDWGEDQHDDDLEAAQRAADNPQLRVIEALARTFGVPAGFFLEDYDEGKLGLRREQVELLALIRDSGITAAQFKTILGMDDEGRKVIADLIRRTIRPAGQASGSDPGGTPEDR